MTSYLSCHADQCCVTFKGDQRVCHDFSFLFTLIQGHIKLLACLETRSSLLACAVRIIEYHTLFLATHRTFSVRCTSFATLAFSLLLMKEIRNCTLHWRLIRTFFRKPVKIKKQNTFNSQEQELGFLFLKNLACSSRRSPCSEN